ncbi:PDR/VanB family oxidoreductase [Hydrogenophaga sp. 5NK40-0174]|uniref:PDR/VanB family oxidoreductase n=1 Tax=Hydrogenophaga sp. 5NK40-0174 TaxID=3127649 RepID=UPI003108D204
MSQPDLPLQVKVAHKQAEAQDICTLELVRADGSALPAFEAGAHIDIAVPGTAAGSTIVRQYSLCNTPGETHRYVLGVLRDAASRGGSAGVHERLNVGDVVSISEPRNHFPIDSSAGHHLLLAGGIGITPLLAMALTLQAQGKSFTLHHATRSASRTPFVEMLRQSAFADRVHHHFDDGAAEQKLDIAQVLAAASPETHLYVCGPQGFMDAVLDQAKSAGWASERVHYEFFGAAPTARADDGSFEIEIASTGQIIPVAPDVSALQAMLDAGFDIPMSCEQGVCGTCLTGVKGGEVDHRDHYLTDEEQAEHDQFMPCCSRARSARLIVDL